MSQALHATPTPPDLLGGLYATRCENCATKATLCESALAEANRMALTGNFEWPFWQLLARCEELLEEMDEILVGVHPTREQELFSRTAALHRELESIQQVMQTAKRS